MKSGSVKILFSVGICLFLAACAGHSGSWPTLSEPLPDQTPRTKPLHGEKPAAEARADRASTHADPAPATRIADDNQPKTAQDAATLLDAIKEDLKTDTLAYRESVAKISGAEGEAKLDAWYDAQAVLTRLSQTASRLDILTDNPDPAYADTVKAAMDQASIIETFVVSERQRLAALKP